MIPATSTKETPMTVALNPISSLVHTETYTPSGGYVLVLNTGAVITPEGRAMLQALHSRSIGGIKAHLAALIKKGPEKFIADYFVGYGHKSIGDMAEVIIFAEGISMLAAKAVQDWPLYKGQEASTRYIDFAHQRIINPAGTPEGERIQETWRAFYLKALAAMKAELRLRYPKAPDEKEGVYTNAISRQAIVAA
jgi:hypothetical protein